MAKFLGNLLKDITLFLFDNTNIIFPPVSPFDSKMPLVTFFLGTRYELRSQIKSERALRMGSLQAENHQH